MDLYLMHVGMQLPSQHVQLGPTWVCRLGGQGANNGIFLTVVG